MLVLGFDTETTGIDPKTANIIEMGAVLFEVDEMRNWRYVEGTSFYIFEQHYLPLPLDAQAVNGITEDMLKTGGRSFKEGVETLHALADKADYIIAHNAMYDKTVLQSQLVRHSLHSQTMGKKWLCSINDLESNKDKKCWKLSHMALDYGVTVNPTNLHTALADVRLMGEMLAAAKAHPDMMWQYKIVPTAVLATDTAKPWDDGGKDNAAAKAVGYSWERPKGTDKTYSKRWVKSIKLTPENLERETRKYEILEEFTHGY